MNRKGLDVRVSCGKCEQVIRDKSIFTRYVWCKDAILKPTFQVTTLTQIGAKCILTYMYFPIIALISKQV